MPLPPALTMLYSDLEHYKYWYFKVDVEIMEIYI